MSSTWKTSKLKNYTIKIGSGVTPRGGSAVYKKSGIPLIRSQNVLHNRLELNDVAYIDEKQHEKMKGSKVYPNDVLLNITGASIGRCCVVPLDIDQANVNQHVCIIRLNDKFNPNFLSSYLNSWYGQKQITSYQSGGSREGLNFVQIGNLLVPNLKQQEQKAIADILSTWDSAIEKTEKLIVKKEKIFKWLLDELITKKAKKEGWKEVKLGDVCEMNSGGTPKSFVQEYYDGDILWISISDMTSSGMYIKDTQRKLTQLGIENSSAKIFPSYTVFFAMYASIGEVCISQLPASSSQAILGIIPNNDVTNHYLYYYLISIKDKIKRQGQIGTQSNINAQMVKKFKIPLPDIEIQNIIVLALNYAKIEIKNMNQILEKYQSQKRGLIQKLLTGKWRVKVNAVTNV
ncbi:MAG: restriction endonuclease subunit S [Candidatus Delongbacteria bacterium]|jgi:type I restriction enzyme S subunit|nr:restriction endonuclease subunit S [Candidatus Delongbacteria bacterium]